MSKTHARPTGDLIRISVAASPLMVRECIGFLIERSPHFELSGSTGLNLLEPGPIDVSGSDVVVVYLDSNDSPDVVKEIHSKNPDSKIVVVVDGEELDKSMKALQFGAVGVVRASQSTNSLVEAIRKAYEGETWINQELLVSLIEKGNGTKRSNGTFGPANDALTPREIEVISMIGKGLKSKAIAQRLSISGATVRHHLSSIYGKLGVDDRLNLVIYAIEKGLVQLGNQPDED